MPNGRPYGAGSAMGGNAGGDPRQRRLLQTTQAFMNQGLTGGTEPRSRPSTYPDVQGFASTPVGRMLLRNIVERMKQQGRPGVGTQGRPAPRR